MRKIGIEKLKEKGGGGRARGVLRFFPIFSCPSTTIELRSLTIDKQGESTYRVFYSGY